MIPVRFIAACELGHAQEFPFMEWVHRDQPASDDCCLRLRAGRSSAGLSGITIECLCQQRRSLGDVFKFDKSAGGPLSTQLAYLCKGHRPWLGEIGTEVSPCNGHLRVLQRGASNVYFSQVISAIYLPLWAEKTTGEIVSLLERPAIWKLLQQRTENGRVDPFVCETVAAMAGVDAAELRSAAERKLAGDLDVRLQAQLTDEVEFRRAEYGAICDGKVGPQSELYAECVDLGAYEPQFAGLFSRIRLVHKLRETRVLAGFTRILPPDGDLQSPRLQRLSSDVALDWLPAIKVYGEGIFLELSNERLVEWESAFKRNRREFGRLVRRYNSARVARQQPNREITPKFLVLHTLAHVLINQLSFDCGYGSASLRERLYCNLNDSVEPMQGILIYTASGDSEGSMGGLVRQGMAGRLESTIRRAIESAGWCSSDPVCLESGGQGTDSANLAACHGCCLLPETSCEEGNRLLDRAVLVGTLENSGIGYFAEFL